MRCVKTTRKKRWNWAAENKAENVNEGGEILNGSNQETGRRNRCYLRSSAYHLSPNCPRRGVSRRDSASVTPPSRSPDRPPYSSTSMESPVHAQDRGAPPQEDCGGNCEQSLSNHSDLVDQFALMDADTLAALDASATANLGCSNRLGRHNSIFEQRAFQMLRPIHLVQNSNLVPVGIAGGRGEFTAFELEADIQALSRKEASEALGGQLDFVCNISSRPNSTVWAIMF